MTLTKYTNRLINVTFPIIKPLLYKHWIKLLGLILLSISLGFIPAIKSGIESNFLNEANTLIQSNKSGERYKELSSLINHSFPKTRIENGNAIDNLPNYFTDGYELWFVVVMYLFAISITLLLEYFSEKLKAKIGRDIFIAIRNQALKKALNSNPSEMPKMFNLSGNLSSSIQTGTGNITSVYDFFASTFQYVFLLATSMVILFTHAWIFGLLFLVALILQLILSIYRAKRLKTDRNELEKSRNNIVAQTEDIIDKKEIILAFEQQEKYSSKINNLSRKYGELVRKLRIRDFVFNRISSIINDLERFLIPVFALLSILFFDSSAITSIGGLFFLITLYSRLSNPVLSILNQYDNLKENEAISNSLLDLLEMSNTQAELVECGIHDENALTFDSVTFSYNGDKKVLQDCSFIIPKNKTTIILGPSGCGKSSIVKIILGFWPIQRGSVYLMGRNLNSYTSQNIRLLSSYISQKDFIVEDTIRENLNWGSGITDEMMLNALLRVKLIRTIKSTDILNKHAKDLSGGEQQRLSLARIMLDDSPLLILDEPLTGVDVYTIKDIMSEFKDLLTRQNRTVILISHKLSFVNYTDNIILFNKEGKVVEQGNPNLILKDKSSILHDLLLTARDELSF